MVQVYKFMSCGWEERVQMVSSDEMAIRRLGNKSEYSEILSMAFRGGVTERDCYCRPADQLPPHHHPNGYLSRFHRPTYVRWDLFLFPGLRYFAMWSEIKYVDWRQCRF